MSRSSTNVCITTLGGQPQVVTLTLDALLARGETFGELILVHLSERNPRYRTALALLAGEFAGERYREHPCRYRPQEVTLGGHPIDDLDNEPAIGAALNTFSRLIQHIKQQDRAIHLCLSGGRRLLGMLALSALQLYGDHADQVWHLYSSDAVREQTDRGAQLHLPGGEGMRLVRVPVPGLGQYLAWPRPRSVGDDPIPAASAQAFDTTEHARCRQVVEKLTPRQRDVLRELAAGLTPQEVAEQLSVTLGAVHYHKTHIFQECQVAWGLTDSRLDYHWLRDRFASFFTV
jgi:CRISPR-associated protein Csx14